MMVEYNEQILLFFPSSINSLHLLKSVNFANPLAPDKYTAISKCTNGVPKFLKSLTSALNQIGKFTKFL